MKKRNVRIWILVLVLLLCAGAAAYAYAATAVRTSEPPAVTFAGHTAAPVRSSFAEPVLGGLLQKRLVEEAEDLQIDLGTLSIRSLPLETDLQLPALWTLWNGESQVFQGTPLEYQAFSYTENGSYRATLEIDLPESTEASAADFFYEFVFELDVQPKVLFSSDRALQGDLLSVYVNRGFETTPPAIETDLGAVVFLPLSPDEYIAYVPVNYAQELGKWDIKVQLSGQAYTQPVIVTSRTYGKQHMIISQSTTDATMNNPEGPANWANRIKVLWETFDEEKYWTETFLEPCEGPISTEFGLYRYTNDNPVPARHSGIDIAAPAGMPVLASNSGKVVRAESIIYTGNTVVIEHGGGLKTYYYHMDSLNVEEGQQIERGREIGKVGSTGYSTGTHLHFEVKLGRSSLSPWELFDGSSEVYFTGDYFN
ncbi:MAG TPA: hypothetical protein DF480_06345 [Clostridiales bacterium]|jgi:hypothetical protein|nr:hypothetical protein [Clostridiales bacterium]